MDTQYMRSSAFSWVLRGLLEKAVKKKAHADQIAKLVGLLQRWEERRKTPRNESNLVT